MIKIKRSGNRSIDLHFNFEDATNLLETFEKLVSNPSDGVAIKGEFDYGVVTLKKLGNIDLLTLILKITPEEGNISISGSDIVWSFEKDEAEYALERFRDCLGTREFSPAEFIQVRTGALKELNDVYGKLIS